MWLYTCSSSSIPFLTTGQPGFLNVEAVFLPSQSCASCVVLLVAAQVSPWYILSGFGRAFQIFTHLGSASVSLDRLYRLWFGTHYSGSQKTHKENPLGQKHRMRALLNRKSSKPTPQSISVARLFLPFQSLNTAVMTRTEPFWERILTRKENYLKRWFGFCFFFFFLTVVRKWRFWVSLWFDLYLSIKLHWCKIDPRRLIKALGNATRWTSVWIAINFWVQVLVDK